MPELHFKGKEYVYNHHLTIPYRPLVACPKKSVGDESENLFIHGDNLHALKALLPHYAGNVDCIFIDPPYNTGNENWSYNDNVNSPMMKEWLDSNPVNKEDMLRHDKWCCLMYPRLKLLHELLSQKGSFWMTLDDNEIHRARMIMDEIFGDENFVAHISWRKMDSPRGTEQALSTYHDHILVYAKNIEEVYLKQEVRESILQAYPLTLPNGKKARRRQLRKNGANARREDRPTMWYKLSAPDKTVILPYSPEGWEGRWSLSKNEWRKRVENKEVEWIKRKNGWVPYYIEIAPDSPTAAWSTIWDDVDGNRQAKSELTAIFGRDVDFQTPKPVSLLTRILEIATKKDSCILDSFAGSSTTAHAVLAQNVKDEGNRKFILVECEDYADTLSAERVRRVINGYKYKGTQKEELLRESITWSKFSKDKKHAKILEQIQSIENLESSRFDAIKKIIKDDELIVNGEKAVTKKAEGLGGGFTYYNLGEPLDLDKILTGKNLPDYASIGAWLFHTATGEPLVLKKIRKKKWYLGTSVAFHVWLIYKPELDFLKSRAAALTLSFAEEIAKEKDKRHLVFAPSRFVPNKMLLPLGVEYAPLPFALYRLEKG